MPARSTASRRVRGSFPPILLALGAALAPAVLATVVPRPASAQESVEIRGSVDRVSGLRAGIVFGDGVLPAVGDTVRLIEEIPGVGEAELTGVWRIAETEGNVTWADPVARAVTPVPGQRAVVRIAGPDALRETRGGRILVDARPAALSGWDGAEGDGCDVSSTPEGLRIRVVDDGGDAGDSPLGGCALPIPGLEPLDGDFLASASFRTVTVDPEHGFGLLLDARLASGDARIHLVGLGGGGIHGTWSFGAGETEEVARTHEAVATGAGSRNLLQVSVTGSSLHYWINGRYLGGLRAPDPIRGRLALWTGERSGTEVVLESLEVRELRCASGGGEATPEALLEENFGRIGGWREGSHEGCEFGVSEEEGDGAYLVRSRGDETLCTATVPGIGALELPARIEVSVRLGNADPETAGLIFGARGEPPESYYVFTLGWGRTGGPVLGRFEGAPELVAEPEGARAREDDWNRVAVELEGTAAHLFLNDVYLGEHDLGSEPGGGVGLMFFGGDRGAVFDDLVITEGTPE